MKNLYLFFAFFSVCSLFSQTQEERVDIVKNSNVEALKELKSIFIKNNFERELRISQFLAQNPQAKRRLQNGFEIQEIYDVINDEVIYHKTFNLNSSITSRANKLYNGGSLGLNIQGQNMTAYVWDGGTARSSHQEFNTKVTLGDGGSISSHATHVTGTIVAQGINPLLRGIAFNASAVSYDWSDDDVEVTDAALSGMLVSNHSYGITVTSLWRFGAYDADSRDFDLIAFNAPFYLGVTAAGNDRNEFNNTLYANFLSNKGGYNLIRNMQAAKNFLTVGAVDQVLNYTGPSSVVMSDFSSWGPTDDGRIKPEIVTKGTSVRSTTSLNDTSSGLSQGTSMASPGIAGTALLLQQYYKSINSTYMRAATLKGLLMHTADEAGLDRGPDYSFGWGLANAERAADVITKRPLLRSIIEENTLNNAQTFTKSIYSDGTEPIMVSISWTDRPGTANTSTIDPTNLNIVNDLDVRVIRGTSTFFPWTLNPVTPWIAAVRDSDNFRDNFEKIEIDNPAQGNYQIVVSHKGTLTGSNQNFSLIVSGVNQTLSTPILDNSHIFINPNPTTDKLFVNTSHVPVSKYEIFDLQGRLVKRSQINDLTSFTIDMNDINVGMYLIQIQSANGVSSHKIIKK
jgi:hypothetical protein